MDLSVKCEERDQNPEEGWLWELATVNSFPIFEKQGVLGQTSNTAGMILILKPREKFSDPKF